MLGKVELLRVAAWSLALVSSFLWKVGLSGQQLPQERYRDHQKTIKIDVFLALYYMCFLDCTWRILKSNDSILQLPEKKHTSHCWVIFFCAVFCIHNKNSDPFCINIPVAFKEVSHWADLPLDFALIGLDGCGTTSLRRNLAKHPATWAVKNGWIPMMDSDDW